MTTSPGRVLFVNENVSGHATMHLGIRHALADRPDIDADFLDVPAPGLLRRLVRAPIPGLSRLDADLAPLRGQLAVATWVAAQLRRRTSPFDTLHVYSQAAGLLAVDQLREHASVVSTDATGLQYASLHPRREPTVGTAARARITARLEARVFAAATIVVAQSEWAASSLRGEYGIPDDRLRVIPFGIVMSDTVERHEPAGLPEVTWVGATMRRKGGTRLLRVFREHLRGRCVLNLVTRDSVEAEPGVRIFPDVRPGDGQLAEILARSTVFAFPSEMDTFGYAALEAMAAGVPVVATRLHAMPELVLDGETGILIDPDDDQLATALIRVLDDVELGKRLGRAARARAREHFDARVTTAALLDVLTDARQRHAHG